MTTMMEYSYALGSVLVRDGRLVDALGALDRSTGHSAIFVRHLIMRQFEEAEQALAELSEQDLEKVDENDEVTDCQQASLLAVELGLRFVSEGDLVAADRVWRLVAARGHRRAQPAALAYLAVARELSGDRNGALRAWQETTAAAAETWLCFGTAARAAGDVDRARWALERANELGTTHDGRISTAAADAVYRLGFMEYENGNRLPALRAFVTATDATHLDRFERSGYAAGNAHSLARELHESGEHEQAAVGLTCLAANGFRRTAVELGREFGESCAAAGNPAAAVHYFGAVTEYAGPESAAWAGLDLGRALVEIDDVSRAHEVLAHVGQSGIGDPAGFADFERYCLLGKVDPTQARQLLYQMANDPNHVLAEKVTLLLGLEQDAEAPAAALATFEESARDGDPTGMFLAAQKLHENGDTERAAEFYRQVVDVGGDLAGAAALSLGAFAEKAGDLEQARAWWLPSVDDPRVGSSTMMNLAVVAKRQRDLLEAKHWFERVMAADTERGPECAAHIGEMCYWEGDKQQAVEWYRMTLQNTEEPELVGEAAYRMGEFLAESGDHEGAREILIRAVEMAFEPFASSASELLRRLTESRSATPASGATGVHDATEPAGPCDTSGQPGPSHTGDAPA